jgi:hypothetical protein
MALQCQPHGSIIHLNLPPAAKSPLTRMFVIQNLHAWRVWLWAAGTIVQAKLFC